MSVRTRIVVFGAAVAAPIVLAPLLVRPSAAFALVGLLAAVALASRSVAWTVGLAGLPALVVALTGSDPFPKGGITALVFGWTVLAVVLAAARGRIELGGLLRSPAFVLTVLLAVWILVRLIGSPGYEYGRTKLQLYVFVELAMVLGGLAIGRHARDVGLVAKILLALAFGNAVALAERLLSGGAAQVAAGRYTLSATYDPIGLARTIGLGLVIALFFLLAGATARLRTAAIVALPVLAVAILASGSRGPLLGVVTAVLVLVACVAGSREARRRLLLVVPGLVVAVLLVGQLVPGQSVSRVFSFVTGGDTTGEDRLLLWGQAWDAFTRHPLAGLGTGGFASIGGSVYPYPHNLVLEVASELGVVGLALLFAVIGYGVVAGYRVMRSRELRLEGGLALAILGFALLNSLFSADITGNGTIWLGVGLAGGMGDRLRRRTAAEEPIAGEPQPHDAGEILAPADGAAVGGVVTVRARPAAAGGGAAVVRIQIASGEGGWRDVRGEAGGFDVFAGDERVASVASRRLAELLASLLPGDGADVRPARGWRPARTARDRVRWDTTGLPPGPCRLRVVTVDLAGVTHESAPVQVLVDNDPPILRLVRSGSGFVVEAHDGGSGVARIRLETWSDGWHELAATATTPLVVDAVPDAAALRAVALDEAGNEAVSDVVDRDGSLLDGAAFAPVAAPADDAERERELAVREGQALRRLEEREQELQRAVAERDAELQAATDALGGRLAEAAARAAELVERDAQLEAAARELEQQQAAVEERLAEAEARAAALADREEALRRVAEVAAERDRRMSEAEHELAREAEQRRSELDAEHAAIREAARAHDDRLRELEEQRAALERRLAEAAGVAEREQALQRVAEVAAERDSRLEVDARELEEQRAALEQRLAEAEARAAELAERDAALRRVAEVAAARDSRLEAATRALEERQAELASREAALQRVAAAAEQREQRLRELEQPTAAVPAPTRVVREPEPVAGGFTLHEIEQLVAERPDPDPFVQEEREATLFHLRSHIDVDGVLPARFEPLLYDVFGPLLDGGR